MSTELTVVQQVRHQLDKMRPELASVLPSHLPVEAFVRITQTALQVNSELQACSMRSVIAAATKCAEAGLQPDGEEGALIAYNVKVSKKGHPDVWEKQAKFLPMVRGIRNQVMRSGVVKDWKVRLVYSQDKFKHIDGDVEVLEHEPAYQEGDYPILVYSIAYLENGELSRHVMRMDTVNKIRARSRSKDNGPWVTDTAEMIKKTCLKQHSKALPKAKEDMARHRTETMLRALDDAEGVVDVEHGPAYDAPRLSSHEAATQRLREAVETEAFDGPVDARFETVVNGHPAEPPRATRKRKTANERLAEAEAGRTGNGHAAPAAAPQQAAAPSSSTPAPAGRSASPAPAAKPSSEPERHKDTGEFLDPSYDQDDGRDVAFEREMSENPEPAGFRDAEPEDEGEDERAEPAAFRDGWNSRGASKTRVPPRTLTRGAEVQAWMAGYDAFQRSVDIGNAPGSVSASRIMCDNQISKLYP